jgi:hypothetical protein
MSISHLRRPIGVFVTSAVLAGCSAIGSAPPLSNPAQRNVERVSTPPLAEPKLRGALLYVSDNLGNFIDVFGRDGKLAGRITAGLNRPADLFVDADHNLWVGNSGDGDVLKFKRGAMEGASVYRDVSNAWDPATCTNGTLYATNFSGVITIFARGHHHPTGFRSENDGAAISVACDAAGNVFATATVLSPPGYVIEFPAGSTQAKLLPINLPNPVDAEPDPAGKLLVLDSAGGGYNTVTEYTEAGSPTGRSMPTDANWNEMAITSKGKAIFGADQTESEGVLRAFPSGKLLQTYGDSRFSQIGGIAFDPG